MAPGLRFDIVPAGKALAADGDWFCRWQRDHRHDRIGLRRVPDGEHDDVETCNQTRYIVFKLIWFVRNRNGSVDV